MSDKEHDLKYDLIMLVASTAATVVAAGAILFLKKCFDMKDDKDVGIGGIKSGGKHGKSKGKKDDD